MYVYNKINNYDTNLLFCYILCVKVSVLRSDYHRSTEYKLKRKEHTITRTWPNEKLQVHMSVVNTPVFFNQANNEIPREHTDLCLLNV